MATKYKDLSDNTKKQKKEWDKGHLLKINIAFRKDDDSDMLESLAEAKTEGLSNREWLRQLFEVYMEK